MNQCTKALVGVSVCLGVVLGLVGTIATGPSSRHPLGRVVRWMRGESTIDQFANDLSEDIRTEPEFRDLQPWAIRVMNRAEEGHVRTNSETLFWRADRAITLAMSETPSFIQTSWGFTNKSSGWVLPELSIVYAEEVAVCVVIDFSSYGVAVGSPGYKLPFDADRITYITPGIYSYVYYE